MKHLRKNTESKVCTRCKKDLPLSQFYKTRNRNAPMTHCKACNRLDCQEGGIRRRLAKYGKEKIQNEISDLKVKIALRKEALRRSK